MLARVGPAVNLDQRPSATVSDDRVKRTDPDLIYYIGGSVRGATRWAALGCGWTPALTNTPDHVAELDRLGNEIAELSAHLQAAIARLLDLIREFDARGGWNTGCRSCAHWLSWRIGLDLGAAREHVRVARALGELPRLAEALARGRCTPRSGR